VVAVGVIAYALTRPRPRFEVIAFGLVIGGALGNLTDRILRGSGFLDGRVIDWIQLPYWPTFNVADSAVSIAIVTLLLGAIFTGRRT
jgi:signal peptidase II